jgi:hypothetical protein
MKVLQAKEILEELAKDAPQDDSQQPKTHGGSWLRRLFGLFRRT